MPTNIPGDISEVKFLTVAEVAAVMRVSKMTVYRLVHNGELPAVRVGRSFRVAEDAVHEDLRGSEFDGGWRPPSTPPALHPRAATAAAGTVVCPRPVGRVLLTRGTPLGSVIKKRRKRMSKKKHRKLLRKTRVQRRKLGK